MEKAKNEIITISFVIMLFVFFIANIVKKDEDISKTERRKLAQFPNITVENVANGKTSKELEKYTVDQFIFRDYFRSVKAIWSDYIFMQKDNNGLFLKDGNIYKIEYPLNENNVEKSANKIKYICDKYLNKNMNVYYSIIPDKNYYLDNDYLKIDVRDMQKIMQKTLLNIEYIDITGSLKLQDYYKTDLHWKQENLTEVVNVLENKMNMKNGEASEYEIQEIGNFYGTYYGQLGRKVEPDKINILTNNIIKKAKVYNYESEMTEEVYNMQKLKNSADKYDVFLSGATPLITIENPEKTNGKELILFRDSFGSSIAPLLIDNYQKITLIDLRYMSNSVLEQYINFKNQDVLFLYSTLILNQNVLR